MTTNNTKNEHNTTKITVNDNENNKTSHTATKIIANKRTDREKENKIDSLPDNTTLILCEKFNIEKCFITKLLRRQTKKTSVTE